MKKYLAVFVVLFLAFFAFAIPALASPRFQVTSTPSPTITAPPPFEPEINVTSPVNFDCLPDGTLPANWGTVTPSSSWETFCGDCYQDEGWYTSTPPASQTARPNPCVTPSGGGTEVCLWGTNTPTPTFTPDLSTPTFPAEGYYSVDAVSCEGLSFDGGGGVDCEVDYYCALDDIVGAAWVSYAPQISNWNEYGIWNKAMSYQGTYQLSQFINSNPSQTVYLNSVGATRADVENYLSVPFDAVYLGSAGVSDFPMFVSISAWDFPVSDTRHGVMSDVRVLCYGENYLPPTSTPAPTPLPNPGAYCEMVSDENSDASLFSYSGIDVHTSTCFDIGPYSLTLLNIFAPADPEMDVEFGIPYIAHFCAYGIDLGVLVIFGVSISFSVIAFTVGVAMALRNLFIS